LPAEIAAAEINVGAPAWQVRPRAFCLACVDVDSATNECSAYASAGPIRLARLWRLTFSQQHDERRDGTVADHVKLGVQPGFRAADTAGKNLFF
jgi:hypothetical protein